MKAVDKAALQKNALPKYNTKYKNAKKKAKKKKHGKSEIDAGNIIEDAPEPHKPEPVVFTIPDAEQQSAPTLKTGGTKKLKQKTAKNLPIGARVKIKTTRFDTYPGSWSKDRPEWTFGTIVEKKSGGLMGVRWDGDDDVWDSHWKHLQSTTDTSWRFVQQGGDPSNKTALAITRVCYVSWQEVEAVTKQERTSVFTILASVIQESAAVEYVRAKEEGRMPRYFFECMVRDDWREWVTAVKRELQGWIDNNAVTVVNIKDVPRDAKIIPCAIP